MFKRNPTVVITRDKQKNIKVRYLKDGSIAIVPLLQDESDIEKLKIFIKRSGFKILNKKFE